MFQIYKKVATKTHNQIFVILKSRSPREQSKIICSIRFDHQNINEIQNRKKFNTISHGGLSKILLGCINLYCELAVINNGNYEQVFKWNR